jgi:hypothetical protein
MLAAVSSAMMQMLLGQMDDGGSWRRTSRGWEHAHAVQRTENTIAPQRFSIPTTQVVARWHGIALPVASGIFMLTFGSWLLLVVENRGIVCRREV